MRLAIFFRASASLYGFSRRAIQAYSWKPKVTCNFDISLLDVCLQVVRAASPVLLRVIVLGAFFIYSTVSTRFGRPMAFMTRAGVNVWDNYDSAWMDFARLLRSLVARSES